MCPGPPRGGKVPFSSRNSAFTQHGIGGLWRGQEAGLETGPAGNGTKRVEMGLIVNPRGPAGSGKTEFVRRILVEDYAWGRGAPAEPLCCNGRGGSGGRPIGYLLRHPLGGRPPLAVLGHYGGTSRGGCDTIRAVDGGLDAVFRLADDLATAGHDVLLEGLLLSAEHQRSAALARRHALHVLRLDTPPDRCARNLTARWHARRDLRPLIAGVVVAQHGAIEEACARLRWCAAGVEVLGFDQALRRARELLGLGRTLAAAGQVGLGHPLTPVRLRLRSPTSPRRVRSAGGSAGRGGLLTERRDLEPGASAVVSPPCRSRA